MITRDVLAEHMAVCEDKDAQTDLAGDLWAHMWPCEDTYWDLLLTWEDVEYASSKFMQGDVLDMMWSSCRNGLN